MIGEDLILKYFPDLTERQQAQFGQMGALYADWNSKINVISRKDIDNLYTNHVLHSLTIARFLGPLAPGTAIMDLGTGGGFPGIPLAVFYPHVSFHLIDRIGKKIKVAADIAEHLGLQNVTFQHGDAGECHATYDYVVSRAVMQLDKLVKLVRPNITHRPVPGNRYEPGLICLKGGDLEEEAASVRLPVIEYSVNEFFGEAFFDTKKLVYVPM